MVALQRSAALNVSLICFMLYGKHKCQLFFSAESWFVFGTFWLLIFYFELFLRWFFFRLLLLLQMSRAMREQTVPTLLFSFSFAHLLFLVALMKN